MKLMYFAKRRRLFLDYLLQDNFYNSTGTGGAAADIHLMHYPPNNSAAQQPPAALKSFSRRSVDGSLNLEVIPAPSPPTQQHHHHHTILDPSQLATKQVSPKVDRIKKISFIASISRHPLSRRRRGDLRRRYGAANRTTSAHQRCVGGSQFFEACE